MPRKRLNHAAYPILLRWCGVAGVLAGVLFIAWGYIENLRAVVPALAIVVPTLFLAALVGLSVLWSSRLGVLGWIGIALAVYGPGEALVLAIVGYNPVWAYFLSRGSQGGWAPFLHGWLAHDWLLYMLSGLTLMGIATVRKKLLRGMGALALAMGASGWIYKLTDTGAVLEARLVHIGFGLLFGLGWVALGAGLLAAGTRRAQRPQARG